MNSTVSPLQEFDRLTGPPAAERDVAATLEAILQSDAFATASRLIAAQESRSFTEPEARALLYWLVRALRMELVIEIGTLFAGTTEILARALAANGAGKIITADPFGAERVPGIIAGWPAAARERTEYVAVNSMQLFHDLIASGKRPDLVFIDGNHDYEFVLFDLLAAARCMRPSGIVILDDYTETGVARAAREFEAAQPRWRGRNFGANNYWRILIAPPGYIMGCTPLVFQAANWQPVNIDAVTIDFLEPAAAGELEYRINLRAFAWDFHLGNDKRETVERAGKVAIAKGTTSVTIETGMRSSFEAHGFTRSYEMILSFAPAKGAEPELVLATEPLPRF